MFDFHEKRKIRSIVYSKVTIGLMLLLAVPLGISVYERFTVERSMAEKREAKEQELEELKGRATGLEDRVDHLQNKRGVEEEIRSRFDVVKEGERAVVIVGDDSQVTDPEELASPPGETHNEQHTFFEILKFW